jgi:FG-GAP-like repeat
MRTRHGSTHWPVVVLTALALSPSAPLCAGEPKPLPKFERIVVDPDFPGGYQVEVADVNGDAKPDIVALGGGVCAWYENPTWKKRIVTTRTETPGVISSATADIDGDGKAEVAIAYEFAMNEPTKGKLLLATQGKTLDDPWAVTRIADIGSIHRLRWAWGDSDGRSRPVMLFVAPIFGPSAQAPTYNQAAARLTVFHLPALSELKKNRSRGWRSEAIGERPVLHAIEVLDVPPDRFAGPGVLTADNLGVALIGRSREITGRKWKAIDLVAGVAGKAPTRGCSEVHLGRLADGRRYLATVDPWHGREVAVYLTALAREAPADDHPLGKGWSFGPRTVIDDTLADGHALWVADVDGDGDDEIFAGHRGKDHRVSAYDFDGKAWSRTILDREIAAQDLRGGDLNDDGAPDLVSIGGGTHNVVWYRPIVQTRSEPKK